MNASDLKCGRCSTTASPVRREGVLTDPPGWACLSLLTVPIRNWLLCPACVGIVTVVLMLEGTPVEPAAVAS